MQSVPGYDSLKLENQICFPLYAAAKEIVRKYKPFLDELDLTYTQYIAMMLLWEKKTLTVSEIGRALYLDSGTLTPLLKKLEAKGYVLRGRSKTDERCLNVSITPDGETLKERAVSIPAQIAQCSNLDPQEVAQLYKILYKILGKEFPLDNTI